MSMFSLPQSRFNTRPRKYLGFKRLVVIFEKLPMAAWCFSMRTSKLNSGINLLNPSKKYYTKHNIFSVLMLSVIRAFFWASLAHEMLLMVSLPSFLFVILFKNYTLWYCKVIKVLWKHILIQLILSLLEHLREMFFYLNFYFLNLFTCKVAHEFMAFY